MAGTQCTRGGDVVAGGDLIGAGAQLLGQTDPGECNEDEDENRERRFEQALASLVDAIVGPSGRGVLSAGLVSLLLNTVEALRPPRPLVVTINPEEWKFVSERVPEFETFMRKTGVKVVTCAETAAASATITHSTGEVRVNLGAFVERLASAVDSASARLGRTATVKGES